MRSRPLGKTTANGRRLAVATALGMLLTTGTLTAPATAAASPALDGQALRQSLDAVHEAGMYGIYSQVREGNATWRGASGVADVETRAPVRPDMPHRVGSISKTFTAVAVLQQVAAGRIRLDAPIGRYLPDLVPGERGERITVRMLLNHTSHLGDYIGPAFPSLYEASPASLDEHRFRRVSRTELARLGLAAAPTGEPGATPGSYSNTNYVLAGLLLDKVTGMDAERYIDRFVIRKAGLPDTEFPRTPYLPQPHSKAYESLYGFVDPPRDYSDYDMSWATTAGAVTSTMADLNRFYRKLLRGDLISPTLVREMQKTVKVTAGGGEIDYGLGLYVVDLGCGRFWGHDGGVFGMATQSLSSPDGSRQLSYGVNRTKYQTIDENGQIEFGPIDQASVQHLLLALCGQPAAQAKPGRELPVVPFLTDQVTPRRPVS